MINFCTFNMKKTFTLLFVLGSIITSAQQFEWLRTVPINYSFNPEMLSYPVAVDSDNNIYCSGFKENVVFNTDVMGTVFLNKYSQTGELIWSKSITGQVHTYRLATDQNGNLYAAVSYLNNLAIDQFSLTAVSQQPKPILLKFNPEGEFLWHKEMPGDFVSHFAALRVDTSNFLWIAYDDFMHSTIEKLDSAGNTILSIPQLQVKLVSDIDVDTEGNVYAVGSCAEVDARFNGILRPAPFLYNTYIVKYNSTGGFQWMNYVEDITCPTPSVRVGTPDEIYFCSQLSDPFPLGQLSTSGPGGGGDFFLTRLDADGNFVWVREVPGSGSFELGKRNMIDLDAGGNIYLAGQTRGNTNWGSVSTQSTGFTRDILILKYQPDGTLAWAKSAAGNGEDRSDALQMLSNGNLIISGMINGSAQFDNLQHTTVSFQYEPFVAELRTSTLGVSEQKQNSIAAYPNPISNLLHLQSDKEIGHIRIYSALGQLVHESESAEMQTTLNLGKLESGVYFLRIGHELSQKIVKN